MLTRLNRIRKSLVLAALVLPAGLLSVGCSQVDIGYRSVVEFERETVLESLLVVVDFCRIDELSTRTWLEGADFAGSRRDTSRFSKTFVPELRAGLAALNVATECCFVSAQDSSLAEVVSRAGDFRYDAVLQVREYWLNVDTESDRSGLMVTRDVTGINFEASILFEPMPEAMAGEAAWQALFGGTRVLGLGVAKMAEELARALPEQLVAEGVIDPTAGTIDSATSY